MEKLPMQSPINIVTDAVIKIHYTPYNFTGYNQPYEAELTCTEFGMSIKLFETKSLLPSMCGGGLFNKFILTTLDFHWNAEHKIDVQEYPLEVQFIHYASKYKDFNNALNYKDGIAILSTFFIVSKQQNDAFENLLETLPPVKIKLCQPVKLLQPVIPRYFLTPKIGKFYRYNGSLTTPCFDETVIWTIFSVPSNISEAQLNALKEIWTNINKEQHDNGRVLQVFNRRHIYMSMI